MTERDDAPDRRSPASPPPARAPDGTADAPPIDPSADPGPDPFEHAARAAAPARVDLPPGAMLNMELSYLAFNERVLELAADPRTPLLERVRFVAIVGGNFDEFYMTRVAGFKRQVAMRNEKRTLDGLTPAEQLELIDARVRSLARRMYEEILPRLTGELRAEGVEILTWDRLAPPDRAYLENHYATQLDEVTYPIPVHHGGPLPHVRNLRPAFLVRPADGRPGDPLFVVELPGDVPRLLPLPGGRRFVPLEEVVRANLPRLIGFAGPIEAHLFRVTRSGNLSLDAENADDIVEAVAANVALRPFQPVVRIEVVTATPAWCRDFLFEHFREEAESRLSTLESGDIHAVPGPLDLQALHVLASLPIDALRYPRARRFCPFRADCTIFDQLAERDVLLRFPRHSFERTVERFVLEATVDPDVEQIWMTLYRTSRPSRLVRLLRRAQRRGKAVTVLVELKASFDEQRNLEWARTLEAAGIRVLYGPPSLKVHAKIASVTRRENGSIRIYAFVGTGNLNAATAATYTDLALMTAAPRIAREVDALFHTLAGDRITDAYEALVVAPFNMRDALVTLIERECENAAAGRPAGLTAKLNGVADREIVAALYRASAAGVDIDLVVRGICAVRPGVPGLSDRIRVVALAGRYLEHSRIIRFANGGEPEYFLGSADWRGRNLSRRVEVVTPVFDPALRTRLDRILREDLENPDAWELGPDGRYVRRGAHGAS